MDLQRLRMSVQTIISYTLSHRVLRTLLIAFCFLAYCEIIHYYVVLLQCIWPAASSTSHHHDLDGDRGHLKVMLLADTHLLGFREGHWFDKLRREWQMKHAFQTSMLIHQPDVVFVLGDLLDEGKWCDDEEFYHHVSRFRSMFAVPQGTQLHVLSGNHDEGFHYMMSKHKHARFEREFESPSVRMLTVKGNTFVLVNSMAMEGDGCSICAQAEEMLQKISQLLSRQRECVKMPGEACQDIQSAIYTQPILLQHFPMYRKSDAECNTEDSAPVVEKTIPFHVKYDCLDKRSSRLLLNLLQPRLVVSAHTHHGCYRVHPNNVPEWSVSSFSWRNRNNPTFLMLRLSHHNFTTSQCFLPEESTVINIYIMAAAVMVVSLLWRPAAFKYPHKMC